MIWLAAGLAGAYLLGSIPTGVWIGTWLFKKDPREGGSGAMGATNMFRQFGAKAGIPVILVDVAKGSAAVLFAIWCWNSGGIRNGSGTAETSAMLYQLSAALIAVAGHVFPIFAGFRGGKGVATGAGALLVIAPLAALWSALGFVLVLGVTGIVSVSSMIAALILPAAVAFGAQGRPPSIPLLVFSVVLALFVLFTHRANIGRIIRGEEKRFEKVRFLARLINKSRSR